MKKRCIILYQDYDDENMQYSWVITGFKETLSAGEDPKIAAYLVVRYTTQISGSVDLKLIEGKKQSNIHSKS